MISLNRVQKLLKSMIGELLSPASLLKFILRLYEILEGWKTQAIDRLLISQAMNVDETSLRVDKKNNWVHVYAAKDITLKCLHKTRGTEAIEDLNIIPRYSGVIIHDCWVSYLMYGNCDHGSCGSHLTRELTHAVESSNYRWSTNMKNLLLETCKKVSQSKDKKLGMQEYENLQKRYRNILTRGEKGAAGGPTKTKWKTW